MMSQNSTRGGFRAVLRVVAAVAFALGTGVLSIAGPTPEERDLGPGDTNRRPQEHMTEGELSATALNSELIPAASATALAGSGVTVSNATFTGGPVPGAGTTEYERGPATPGASRSRMTPTIVYQDTVKGGCVSGSTCITFDNAHGPDGGTITFPSVPPDALPIFGFLYFQYLTVTDCSVDRIADFADATINGVNINTLPFAEIGCLNADACFPAVATHFYRVDVSTLFEECDLNIATFELRNFGIGNNTNTDWVEGATLMVAYCSESSPSTDITLIEEPQVIGSGPDSSAAIAYSWSGLSADGASATLVLGIGNGQNNGGEAVAFETTSTPPTELGDGSGTDGLFDGDLCLPGYGGGLGGMYDNTVLDVSRLVNAGDTTATLTINLTADCLDSNAAFLCVSSNNSPNNCIPDACIASTGSCCNTSTFYCEDLVPEDECPGPNLDWEEGVL